MSKLEIHQIPVLNDNYLYLIKDIASDAVGIVDPAVAGPVLEKLDELGWKLTHILNTHHHMDHTGANLELKEKTGCVIAGSKSDASRIPGIDILLSEGDTFDFGTQKAKIFEVSGHTTGHIAYWFEGSNALFCGDTLFALGCGRLFEGTPAKMWESLSKLIKLPGETQIYCAHEYTLSNAEFALTVEPDNADLTGYVKTARNLREKDRPTVPSTIGAEKRNNPFMRAENAEDLGRIRAAKDQF